MQTARRESPKWVQMGGLLLLLVVLPLGSFYYLKKGADIRRAALAEFGEYGPMPDPRAFEATSGKLPDSLRGNMFVLGWLADAGKENREAYGATWRKLGEQFKDSPHIYFVTLIRDEAVGRSLVADYELEAYTAIQPFLSVRDPEFSRMAERIGLPLSEYDAPGTKPVVALADSSLQVRNYYDLSREEDVKRLVSHIALFIPLPAEKDILIDRKKEL